MPFKILTGTPRGRRPLGRFRRKWEDNIRMDFKEFGINRRNWIDSTQDRDYWRTLVNAALNLRASTADVVNKWEAMFCEQVVTSLPSPSV